MYRHMQTSVHLQLSPNKRPWQALPWPTNSKRVIYLTALQSISRCLSILRKFTDSLSLSPYLLANPLSIQLDISLLRTSVKEEILPEQYRNHRKQTSKPPGLTTHRPYLLSRRSRTNFQRLIQNIVSKQTFPGFSGN